MQQMEKDSSQLRPFIENLKANADAPKPIPPQDHDADSVAVVVECLEVLEDIATVVIGRMLLSPREVPDPMPDWQRPMRVRDAVAKARLRRAWHRRRLK
jgi:hypothetical protein